ncbi:GPW/gp25 family protein [Paenibacillus tyrfis]|uniref:IraD/Gp25-like domain-containing protein n=1 Tax=Paenibacillus tyrfis TaxID=1501230 RepID=A0A081NYB0_9BACL|nr:hypothetical protein [Paenibacillus tyrfis]KEQ23433.1 hypothetical protein ET33_16540 [Paenibacillus tyrfis]
MTTVDEWTDIYLDDEGNFREALDGDVQLVSGDDAILQDIQHELETVKGSYPFDREYGLLLVQYLQRENTKMAREELIQDIKERLRQHSSIDPGSVVVQVERWTMREIVISASFRLLTAKLEDPRSALKLLITVDGVRLIRS